MVTSACQPCRSILVTLPTVTSATRTREFGSMLSTSGICAWMVKAPGPRPWTPGNGIEFSPCQPPHPDTAVASASRPAVARNRIRSPRRGTDEEVHAERREVVLAVLDDRRKVLHAQLRRLFCAQPGRRLHRTAEEGDRVGEVVDRQDGARRALGRLIDVDVVLDRRW